MTAEAGRASEVGETGVHARRLSRGRRARAAAAVALAVGLLGCPREGAERPSRPPLASGNGWSVLLVTIDTLRADHLGVYGYSRATSPNIDALARAGTVFDEAFTYWPKTRGSFVALMTGRRASQTGYGKTHPMLLGFNPTLASVLHDAGYVTAAALDNANVAAALGYAKGFETYRETWEEPALKTEMDRARAITESGVAFLEKARPEHPFLLWLHYVNPHAPYTPPPPFDEAFLDARAAKGPALPVVDSLHGGIPARWAVPGRDRLGYYVAQYDGEIAAVDAEVGRVMAALRTSPVRDRTVVLLTADHGESLGEHDYYFDHGEDLFDPCLHVPLMIAVPGGPRGRRSAVLASTLDLLPTLLDAVKVSYPPDLAGRSLLPVVTGGEAPSGERLFAQNDRNLTATFDRRYKLVATPQGEGVRFAFYDRQVDPGETRDVSAERAQAFAADRRALEAYVTRVDAEWASLREALSRTPGEARLSPVACERLKALGYLPDGCDSAAPPPRGR
jgi:arylsulfatase A-like enzyme